MRKLLKIFLVSLIFILTTVTVKAATFSISASKSSVAPGEKFSVNISFSGEGRFSASVSNGTLASSSEFWYPDSKSVSVTAGNSDTVTVTIVAVDAATSTEHLSNVSKSVPVKVVKPATNPGGGSGSGGGSGTADPGNNIYNPELPKAETPEEKAARELEAKMKIPVVSSIEIFSEATRLKGKLVGSVETKENTFEYGLVLPRGVNAFKLIMNPTNDDVEMDYTQMYKLDNGHDKVEVRVKASEGEVEQTYIINVTMADESDVSYQVGEESYTFLNDALLDALFKPYGFEVTYFEGEDALDYYYQYGENKLVLVSNDAGEGKWLLIDEDKTVLHEVILVSDDNHVVMVVDQELDLEEGVLSPTYGGNPYTLLDMPSLDVFTDFGMDLNFKTQAHGWMNNEESLFTHVIDENGDVRLAHINMDGEGEIAYVAFDAQKVSNEILIYQVVSGVLGALVLTMVFVYRRKAKQFNELFRRRSDMNS